MLRTFVALSVVAVAAWAQSPTPTTTPDPVALLRWVEHADPKVDLQRNIAKGDLRFLVFNGIASNIRPGNASDERVAKYGTRLIEGTMDGAVSKEHLQLQLKAHKYAYEYNELLLEYLKSRE